jgi:hemerythrin superfamily protein
MSTIYLSSHGTDAVEILKSDHVLIKSLVGELAEATDGKQRRSALSRLKAVLTIHNATEENLVYPALAQFAQSKGESDRLFQETAGADVLVFELDTMLQTGAESDFRAKAAKLRDAVLAHIEEEENTAFPKLQDAADPDQSKSLTRAVREFRDAFRVEKPHGEG